MEDIFYFAKTTLIYRNIQEIAERIGYKCYYRNSSLGMELIIETDEVFMQSHYETPSSEPILKETHDHWECWQWTEDQNEMVPLDQLAQMKLAKWQPTSRFIISYRVSSIPKLRIFFQQVLETHGGWVCVDDNWEEIYDATNINEFTYEPDSGE